METILWKIIWKRGSVGPLECIFMALLTLSNAGVPKHFSKYWCEQASSAAQVCKEINEAKRSAIYLQNEQGMDDAQRAEKRRLGGKSSKSDGLKLRRYTIN